MHKKITLFLVACSAFLLKINAQHISPCSADEQYLKLTLRHPEWKSKWKKIEAGAEKLYSGGNNFSVQQVVTIPVVVHVIYHNSNENISDAQILSQIDVLNEDFRRLNADTNVTRAIFKPVAGDAQIQFCMAQRDPAGNLTNGIIRTYTSHTDWGCDDSMKFTAYGGQDGWPGDQYLNIWVVNLNCANGYAYYPGTPDPYDGIVVHYYVFGRVGNVAAGHNGRTGTHEVGHYLGLYHTFDYGLCTGTTAFDCSGSGDKICDTPASDDPGYGCDTTLNTCTDTPINFPNQIENYMDYADDVCRNMFTLDQINRMRSMIFSFRNTLLTSPACISPVGSYSDASILEIAKPFQEICSASFDPLIKIGNISSGTLNTLEIHYKFDSGPFSIYNWNGALATGYTAWVTLPNTAAVPGLHTMICYVSNPNGNADQNAANDTLTISFTVLIAGDGIALPFTEGFENGIFPPPGWFLSNPDYDRVWEPTNDASGYGASTTCALFRNFYNGSTGTHDGLISPKFDFTTTANTSVTFDVAYSEPNSSFYSDTLKLFYSFDCGETWTQVFAKGGNQLSTAPAPSTFSEFIPDSSQWRTETVAVPAATGNPLVTFKFENVSYWGNNLYLDNINIPAAIGMNELEIGNWKLEVYPNPVSSELFMRSSEKINSITLTDVHGKVILNREFIPIFSFQLSTSDFPAGFYNLQLNCDKGTVNRKIILTK